MLKNILKKLSSAGIFVFFIINCFTPEIIHKISNLGRRTFYPWLIAENEKYIILFQIKFHA